MLDSKRHFCYRRRTPRDAVQTNAPHGCATCRVPPAALGDQNLLIMKPKSVSVAVDLLWGPTPGEQMRLLRAASRTYRLLAGIQLSDWRRSMGAGNVRTNERTHTHRCY